MAAFAQTLAIIIMQFGRKRPLAHTCCVSFYNPQHKINRPWPNTSARGRLAGNHVGRGHERVRPEINIQKCALRPFKQYPFTRLAFFSQNLPNRLGKFQHTWRNFFQCRNQRRTIHFRQTHATTQCIVVLQQTIHTLFKRLTVSQISHTNSAPPDFIFIRGANTAPGCTDFGHCILLLTRTIQLTMHRQDQRRIFCNHQVFRCNINTLSF